LRAHREKPNDCLRGGRVLTYGRAVHQRTTWAKPGPAHPQPRRQSAGVRNCAVSRPAVENWDYPPRSPVLALGRPAPPARDRGVGGSAHVLFYCWRLANVHNFLCGPLTTTGREAAQTQQRSATSSSELWHPGEAFRPVTNSETSPPGGPERSQSAVAGPTDGITVGKPRDATPPIRAEGDTNGD